MTSDNVSILVNGISWTGWTSVEVTRGVEVVPATFTLTGTEKYPGEVGIRKLAFLPGSPCQIMFGTDVVLTGYVDGIDMQGDANSHSVTVVGRSKLEDLIDCTGLIDQNIAFNRTLGSLATLATSTLGITVSLPDGDTPAIPAFSASLTESGYDSLARFAQMYAKLLYDDPNGNLVIADVGDNAHASGFQEGVNIEAYQSTLNVSERYTVIGAVWQDTEVLTDGTGVFVVPLVKSSTVTDDQTNWPPRADGKPRTRQLLIVAEVNGGNPNILIPQRTRWEMARRRGRGQAVTVTCDSWRDSGGDLWTPNWLAPVTIASAKFDEVWLIASVTFLRDATGTHAQVTLMPPEAFTPAPMAQNFFDPVVAAAAPGTGAQTPTK